MVHGAARGAGGIGGGTAEDHLRAVEQAVSLPGGSASQGERALGEVTLQGNRPEPRQVGRAALQRAGGVEQDASLVRSGVEAVGIAGRCLGQREPGGSQRAHRSGSGASRFMRGIGQFDRVPGGPAQVDAIGQPAPVYRGPAHTDQQVHTHCAVPRGVRHAARL